MHLLPFELALQGQARFQSREQEKTGKPGWVEVGEDHGGMSGSEYHRSLEFRMCRWAKGEQGIVNDTGIVDLHPWW